MTFRGIVVDVIALRKQRANYTTGLAALEPGRSERGFLGEAHLGPAT